MKLYKINLAIATLALSAVLPGCLKDQPFDNGQIQSLAGSNVKVISLGIQTQSAANMCVYAYPSSNKDTIVNFVPVELGGPSVAPQDIHVTVVQADTIIDNYNNDPTNQANGNFLQIPTSSQFSIVNAGGVVTIPKGSRVGYLQIKFLPSALIGTEYGLGWSIKSVQESGYTVSGNLNIGITAMLIENGYDGLYKLYQTSIGWGAYGISDGPTYAWPSNITFATAGASSNNIVTQEAGAAQTGFTPGGGITAFGAATPQYNFDGNNNLVSITNLTPDSRNRAFTPIAGMPNKFDPATHNIIMYYYFSQTGRPNQTIIDSLVYVGPR
jgi:hypothetical protein